MNARTLENVVDQFQRTNNIDAEDLLVPAATVALALVNKKGEIVFDPNNTKGVGTGASATKTARATFDPSGDTLMRTIGAHSLGVTLPIKAIITRVYFDVITTFTSATDAATIALHAQSAGDMQAALAISDARNMFDAGIHAGLQGYPNLGADAAHDSAIEVGALFAGTFLKLTAARTLTATVAVEALTAGKLVLFVDYVVSA